jgi:hypothetical protein
VVAIISIVWLYTIWIYWSILALGIGERTTNGH